MTDEQYLKAFKQGCKHIKRWACENRLNILKVRFEEKDIILRYICTNCGSKKEKKWYYSPGLNMYVYNDTVCAYGSTMKMRVNKCLKA